ncbi:glutaminase A [Actinotalea sp. K2]|uniref:glutaminase A n=1 Tax=Actinotalea sp. K2 TaxID=2939438 RepID=UPI002016D521|nr:glutaminase A [Actinotalea sp. K2]MCL3862255.1 glutaminase A [Actinotalea sp. K2]
MGTAKRSTKKQQASTTGRLPDPGTIRRHVEDAYATCRDDHGGQVADYIPGLAQTPADLFGICFAAVDGQVYEQGDVEVPFSIQSISKPFVYALVCEAVGHTEARERLGVNGTGLPFDSVMAVELHEERTMNPLVNAGAIATTSLVPGDTVEDKWQLVLRGLSRFAGRDLELDEEILASESESNRRNRGIAHLLRGYDQLYFDPDGTTEVYTRQCSIAVTVHDLAIMAATLADGGVNPVTGERVVDAGTSRRVLAVMATAGMYERSGDWLYEVGLPGKSGVSGGIVTVSPGKGGLGTFSPPLDDAGNSVRGQRATRELSERLGLNLFASGEPIVDGDMDDPR